jgi:endo-alpha-N-acetylgalactosaminidase
MMLGSLRPGWRRATSGLSACTVVVAGVVLVSPAQATAADAKAADTSVTSGATAATPLELTSDVLRVRLSPNFPQVLSYTDLASGAVLGGQPTPLTSLKINGTSHAVTATVTHGPASAAYQLSFADLPDVGIDATVSVEGGVVTFKVTKVTDTAQLRVGTLDIPGFDLLSVSSRQAGAATAFTTVDTDSTKDADVIKAVKATDAVQSAPVGAAYAIVNTGELAASIETNGTYDSPTGATTKDNGRFWTQVRDDGDGAKRVGVAPGQWTVRGEGAPKQSELPWAKVVVTRDANGDKKIDWQDGAVAFRGIGVVPAGADEVPDRVIQHIPFNFGSQATHPFLRTLDDVKRLSLATDGLGQFALLKGYASEGHDSAHPDYADNYNLRAGGLKDLNTLLSQGDKWGADFGVHVNATEAYPDANAFDEDLVDKTKPGWNWLGQSYYINQRRDLNTGNVLARLQKLRDETDSNLKVLYFDVYYSFGWIPDSMDAALRDQGWQVASEWAYAHERNSLWSHWATDRSYGGATNKGINSTIIRFIRNGQKDVWNPDPILGSSTIVEAEGWTGHNDWNALDKNVWTNQLPTKFLQHYDITKWTDHDITFSGGVRGSDATGTRQLFVANAKVLDGDSYLLPWGPKGPQHADKAYHYSAKGGTSTWQLAPQLRSAKSFTVYELTDTGRVKVGTVANTKNSVTLTARAGTPYVLYPDAAPASADPTWGQDSGLVDPGFNAGDLDAWHPTGDAKAATDDKGGHLATLGAGAASLSQPITGLTAGKRYAASAWVEVAPGESRPTTVRVTGGGVDVANEIQRSTVKNAVAADEKHDTYFQRVRVIFTAPADGKATLSITAGAGSAAVRVDDARVVETTEPATTGSVIAQQDFEGVDQGWMPFVSALPSATDARSVLAKRHAPYTQAGWNGKLVDDVLDGDWSLKAHEENQGMAWRTWQGTVPFKAGHRYRVDFDYQNATAGAYSLVVGADQVSGGASKAVDLTSTPFAQKRTTTAYSGEFTTGSCGDYFLGVRRNPAGAAQADFIMDNLKVTDLGASEEPAACSTVSLAGPASGLVPGEANTFTTTFTNYEAEAATAVTVSLSAPSGWTVSPTTTATFASIAPGATAKTTWRVVVPATTAAGSYDLSASAAYTVDGGTRTTTTSGSFATLPAGKIPQSRLSVSEVSDADTATGGAGPMAIDGNTTTMWHSAWSQVDPDVPYPHHITLDLGDQYDVNGYDYQVRIGNGSIKGYELYVSAHGTNWGTPVKTGQFASTTGVQHLDFTAKRGRFVKLVGLSSINGAVFAGAGELNVWGTRANAAPVPLPKDDMVVTETDSQETEGEDGKASNVIDGDTSTYWHTEWLDREAPYPHHVTVDLGASTTLSGISIQGRPGSEPNGRIKDYEVYVSADGTTWGTPVAKGSLTATTAAQDVTFTSPATGRFVKVVGLNAINGAAFASIAELEFFGGAPTP